jgi:hypothetical protein
MRIEKACAAIFDAREQPIRGTVSHREKLLLAGVLLVAAGWVIFRFFLTLFAPG